MTMDNRALTRLKPRRLALPFRRRRRYDGLLKIACVECRCDLDWAQPEFVDRYPMPRCALCNLGRTRRAIYPAAVRPQIEAPK